MAEKENLGVQPKAGPPKDPQQSVDVADEEFQRLRSEQHAASGTGSSAQATGPIPASQAAALPAPVTGAHVPSTQARADGRVQEWLTPEEKEALDEIRAKGKAKTRPVIIIGDIDVRRGYTERPDGSLMPRIVRIPSGTLLSQAELTEDELKTFVRLRVVRRATLDELDAAEKRTAEEKQRDDDITAALKSLGDKPKKVADNVQTEIHSPAGTGPRQMGAVEGMRRTAPAGHTATVGRGR